MLVTHSGTIFAGSTFRSFLSNVALQGSTKENCQSQRTCVNLKQIKTICLFNMYIFLFLKARLVAYSVSFGSRNASASSLSRHTLQTWGSLSSYTTSRSNSSLWQIRNKKGWVTAGSCAMNWNLYFKFSDNVLQVSSNDLKPGFFFILTHLERFFFQRLCVLFSYKCQKMVTSHSKNLSAVTKDTS